ncbi:MAG: helix-turn-helix domain-containing protein [Solirubrobacteraceae bacterium]
MGERTVIRAGPDSLTLRDRWLGARLREKRAAAGLTAKEAARRMQRSHSTLSQWESGAAIPRLPDLAFLLDIYDVRGEERDALLRLQEEVRERRSTTDTVSAVVRNYVWLESRASKLEIFQDITLPGLLQIPEYARHVIKGWDPAASAERIERTVEARLARQARLTSETPLQLSVILDEAVLRRPVGGTEVMRAQLRHLVDRASLPTVELRVIPFAAYARAAWAGFPGPFLVMHSRHDPPLAQVVTRGGDIYFEDVEPFALALRRLAKATLTPRRSLAMIAAVRREIT